MQYAIDNNLSAPFVILEDDLIFDVDFPIFKKSVSQATSNWQVLQYHVLNEMARKWK